MQVRQGILIPPPQTDPPRRVLELAGIGRRYGIEPPIHALTDIHLGIDQGDWVAITGPSGSGKSTLLNILGCLDRPTTGTYRIDGIDTTTLTDRERAGVRSRRIGFVFQSFHLLALSQCARKRHVGGGLLQPAPGRTARAGHRCSAAGRARAPSGLYADETLRRRASAGSYRPCHRRFAEPAAL